MVHESHMNEVTVWVTTGCDGLRFMNDWGTQQALLVSPAMRGASRRPACGVHLAGRSLPFYLLCSRCHFRTSVLQCVHTILPSGDGPTGRLGVGLL